MNNEPPIETVSSEELESYNSWFLELFHKSQELTLAALPPILWHYTSGDTFIRIIESGTLWSTQIACLNDHTEFKYAADLLRTSINEVGQLTLDEEATHFCELLFEQLGNVETGANGQFVACMSEEDDDLSQWRAYGGGEGGFAIGFDALALFEAFKAEPGYLIRVRYEPEMQHLLTSALAKATVRFYCDGLRKRPGVDRDRWRESFLRVWEGMVSPFAVMLKHNKFKAEKEWRFVRHLGPNDVPNLQFLQRRTLMFRHLPLKFHLEAGYKPLPIVKIKVGPCRYKHISWISAGDLLKKKGYDLEKVKVEETEVPL